MEVLIEGLEPVGCFGLDCQKSAESKSFESRSDESNCLESNRLELKNYDRQLLVVMQMQMIAVCAIGPSASTWQFRNECDVAVRLVANLRADLKPVDHL